MKSLSAGMILMLALALPLCGGDLTILSECNPPFSFQADQPRRGIAIDLLQEMFLLAGRDESIESIAFIPWARAYKSVQEESDTMLFPMARTEQRENLFQWVGPIYRMQIGLIAKKSSHIAIEDINDLDAYNVGTVRDGAPEQLLLDAGANMDSLERVKSIDQNLRMLVMERVDMIAYNIPSTLYNLKQMGEDPSDYEAVFIIREVELHYALNKNTQDRVIQELQFALDALVESGRYGEIVQSYLGD